MIKKFFLKIIRQVIGTLVAFVSYITTPKPVQRSPEQQAQVDTYASNMAIYQYFACPFCIKTRRVVRALNLPIEYRDAQKPGSIHRTTLEREGGKIQVPCLRIEENGDTRWMYESSEIIAFLNKTFHPDFQE